MLLKAGYFRLFSLFAVFFCANSVLNAQTLEYRFQNTFAENTGSSVPLTPISNGTFVNEVLSELTCIPQVVYHFDKDNGIQYDNNSPHPFLSSQYSVELYFKLDSTNGYCKILDYKSPYANYGLYCTDNLLEFYPVIQAPTLAFTAGQYVHLVVTRDSLSDLVNIYVDGVLSLSFTDSTELATLDNGNLLSFFVDDDAEESSGSIALLKLYNHKLTATEVISSFNNLHDEISPITVSVNNPIQCLNNNSFGFYSSVSDSSNAYTFYWSLGDGNFEYVANSLHSYSASGNYTAFVNVSSGGCIDSTFITIIVNPDPIVNLGSDTVICMGNTLNIDAGSGFNGYVWSDGTTTQNLQVQNAGLYNVMVTDVNGCKASDSISLQVNDLSGFNIGNDTTICTGTQLSIDAGSGYNSYTWNNSAVGQLSIVDTSGLYAVIVTDNYGCTGSDDIAVTVAPLPSVSLGNFVKLCTGSSLILDAGAGYMYYLWNDSTQNQTIVVSAPGIYLVSVTDSNGCKNSDDIIVAGASLPVVNLGNDTSICSGDVLNLDAGAGQYTYLWLDNSSSQYFQVIYSGTYAVQVTTMDGCKGSDTIEVTVNNVPQAAMITLQSDTLFSNFSYGNQWYDLTGAIPGATKKYYIPQVNGAYYVIRKNSFNCHSDTSNIIFYSSTGTYQPTGQIYSVYPNPASDFLIINLPGIESGSVRIFIRNIMGEIVLDNTISNDSKTTKVLLDQLKSGLYSVSVESTTGVRVQKVIILKP